MARAFAVLALASIVACKSNAADKPVPSSAAEQASASHDTEVAFVVTSKVEGACVAGTPCTVKLHLTAARDYHVNEEYPYRFAPQPSPALTFATPQPAFAKESEREGTLPITFIPKNAGPTTVAGTFKLSVCNKDVCLIEESKVSVDVTATSP